MGFELTGLEGEVAVVTGAGRLRSIGRPCAIELARAGCDIVLNAGAARGAARGADRVPVIDLEPDVSQNVLQTNLTGTFLMSREMARYNVRVNAICPGIIDTARMDDIDAIERGAAWQAMIRERIPLGRAGRGEDIARITVFLCSDQGAWITGQSWNVDGGTVTAH